MVALIVYKLSRHFLFAVGHISQLRQACCAFVLWAFFANQRYHFAVLAFHRVLYRHLPAHICLVDVGQRGKVHSASLISAELIEAGLYAYFFFYHGFEHLSDTAKLNMPETVFSKCSLVRCNVLALIIFESFARNDKDPAQSF